MINIDLNSSTEMNIMNAPYINQSGSLRDQHIKKLQSNES